MARLFSRTRCVELSLVKYITDTVNANWSGISVVKDYLQSYEVPIPVICVIMASQEPKRWEIGDSLINQVFTFQLDIFASSDGQRIDLDDFVVNSLLGGQIQYYDCAKDPSNSSNIIYTPNGNMTVLKFITDRKVNAPVDARIEDKFRQTIMFTVSKYDSNGGSIPDVPPTQTDIQFTQASLESGNLLVLAHQWSKSVQVVVYNNLGQLIVPDSVTLTSNSLVSIGLSNFYPIVGTWTVSLIAL